MSPLRDEHASAEVKAAEAFAEEDFRLLAEILAGLRTTTAAAVAAAAADIDSAVGSCRPVYRASAFPRAFAPRTPPFAPPSCSERIPAAADRPS